ncbi:MAG: tetratricopeptide repeat protein [Armatimonadetes bacterium]|nr:tetratricopeptide repeat protein [Armatimonadota bacterium]MDW8120935.1 tetratricopeptide repeat protein [Armatimonadota bacterium]
MTDKRRPTGTVTFLFTDIEGSTALWEHHKQDMGRAVALHDQLLRSVFEKFGGYVFKTVGDAFCVAFPRATEAVIAAIEAQLELLKQDFGPVGPLKVRTAIHTGEAEERDGDYFGPTLNRCARILGICHGGQILLSSATADVVRDALGSAIHLKDLGEHRLRDLIRPERIYQVVHPELRADFPPLKGLEAYPNNLPVQLTSFIGREKEIEEVKQIIQRSRMLTLVGTGGVGKTRLSLQVGAEILEDFPGGVWFIELAPITDGAFIPSAIASALSLREEPGKEVMNLIIGYLRDRDCLLVLDNCEHLLDDSARLADRLLKACPKIKILASSRQALGVPGEITWRVPSLPTPEPTKKIQPDQMLHYASVRLFEERARTANPSFEINEETAPWVAQICWRLDGIPLALELAAARMRTMTVQQIAQRLDRMFQILTAGSRTLLPRQQTLRALIDWSYDLLQPKERIVFRRLSVFSGSFTEQAAEAIIPDLPDRAAENPDEAVEDFELITILADLVDKSLLLLDDSSTEVRYRMLQTLRAYAEEKLAGTGEAEILKRRHAEHYVAFAEEAEGKLSGADQKVWLEKLDWDHDNIRAAIQWALEAEPSLAFRFVNALWRFWEVRGFWSEGREWLERCLGKRDQVSDQLAAEAFLSAGVLSWHQGDYPRAEQSFQEALALFEQVGDPRGVANALNNLGLVAHARGDFRSARSYYERALEVQRERKNDRGIATALNNLGLIAFEQGDFETALKFYQEALQIQRKIGHRGWQATTLNNLGLVAFEIGRLDEALRYHEESLAIRKELGDRAGTAMSYCNLGDVWLQKDGDIEKAESFYKESLILRRDLGDKMGVALSLHRLGCLELIRDNWDDAEKLLAECLSIFYSLEMKEGIAIALEALAQLFCRQGNGVDAVLLLGAATALREQIGIPLLPSQRPLIDSCTSRLKEGLGTERFQEIFEQGKRQPLEEVVRIALRTTPVP